MRRPDVEQAILAHRRNGVNRDEIYALLQPEFKELTPSPSTIYRIFKRHGINRLRLQTNGKVVRFWRTLNEDLIEGTTFETVKEFKDELEQYLVYYNEYRPHQGINTKTPKQMNDSCQRQ